MPIEELLRIDTRYKFTISSKGQWQKQEAEMSPECLICCADSSSVNGISGIGVLLGVQQSYDLGQCSTVF